MPEREDASGLLAEPKVLIVDDEPINIMVLRGMLSAAGFRIVTATDGPTARALAKQERPDIALLDIMMPGENGFETCRQLKLDPAVTDMPIIFISALSDVGNKVQGLEIGAVDYITKPFDKAEVMARIRLHLKLKFAHRALIEEQAAKVRQIAEAQRSILVLPEDCPAAHFAVRYIPALEAGGDFYDVFPTGRDTHCYFVADICGHDLGASFVTSSLKALLRQNAGPLYTPVETMKNINAVLSTILKDGKYLTALGCWLDRGRMLFSVVNAGHPPLIHVDAGGAPKRVESEGDILGVFESVCFELLSLPVAKGDRFFLYTDGLIERFDGPGQSRAEGEEKLLALCREWAKAPLSEAVGGIMQAFCPEDLKMDDDVVLLGVEA